MADGAFRLKALEILLDRRKPAAERVVGGIDERRIPPMLRKHVSDAVAHRSRTHHGHLAHVAATGWLTADG